MALEVFTDVEQNSESWFALRRGLVTSSQFATVMANGRGGAPSITRRKYMLALAADRLGAEPPESYTNSHLERGHLLEQEAADYYSLAKSTELQKVGFVRNGQVGSSPDRFVGSNGLVEIKTKLPYLLLECLLSGEFPAEFAKQCQGQLWVCEREWVDLVVYWPGLKPLIVRAERNERAIAEIKVAVDDFLSQLNELVERIRSI
jgi:putative phage-type endonuclease